MTTKISAIAPASPVVATPINGADASAVAVIDRLAGTLAPGNALAAAVGFESLSGISGLEKPGFTWRHRLDGVWAWVGMIQGEGEVECSGEVIHARPGTVYLIPPGVPFLERNTSAGPWGFACLLLKCAEALIPASVARRDATALHGQFDTVLRLAEVVRALHFRPPGFEAKAVGGTLSVLGTLRERLEAVPSAPADSLIARAISVIRGNLARPLSLAELAGQCRVSLSLLSHRFRQETGLSPIQYARRERITAAKELILAGATVKQAAAQLGFSSPFHLSKLFTAQEGRPPVFFRSLARRRGNGPGRTRVRGVARPLGGQGVAER